MIAKLNVLATSYFETVLSGATPTDLDIGSF
jgi:hypothetical protein